MGYTKHDYQSNDILYAADLAEMDNQIYKNEQDIIKLEENKQPAGNYASTEEVSQLRSDLNDLSNMKSGAIIQTASGESIVANDSSDDLLRGLRVFGKTEQVTTTGAQLVSSYRVNESIGAYIRVLHTEIDLKPSTTYKISFKGTKGNNLYLNENTFEKLYLTVAEGVTIVTARTKDVIDKSDLGIYNAESGGWNIFKNTTEQSAPNVFDELMINEGDTALPYEPYTGGIPSPNPQYPQELVSVGTDGDVEVGVYGGNLFDKNNARYVRGIACESQFLYFYNNGLQHVRMYYMDAEPNTSYFISKTVGVNLRVCTCPEIPSDNGSITSINANTSENSCVMTTGSEDKYIAFYLLWTAEIDSGITYESVMDTLMVAKGDTYVPYEPYHKQSLTALTPNGLPGIKLGTVIPDVIANSAIHMSGVYWNEDDDQYYIADTIDFERGVYVQRIGRFDLSAANWKLESYGANTYLWKTLVSDNKKPSINTEHIPVLAEYYRSRNASGMSASTTGEIATDVTDVKVNTGSGTEKPTGLMYYILATPIETPLSEEELTAYRALHSNYPVTTVLNDSGANMEVKYNADTKNYIDNKFAEMTNAILSMGGNV